MKHARLRLAIRAFGKLALLSITFLLGVFATAVVAAVLDAVASSPAQPLPATDTEQTFSAPQPTVEQPPSVSSTAEEKDSEAWPNIPPLALSRGRTLLTRGATLHMIDANNRVLWSWSAGEEEWPFITDQPIVDSSGTIYVVGMDLTLVALDINSGREKWREMTNVKSNFFQIEKYAGDRYLVLSDTSEYGASENFVTAYKGKDILWSINFPRDAELIVRGGKIYALLYSEHGLEMREIPPPDEEFSCSC